MMAGWRVYAAATGAGALLVLGVWMYGQAQHAAGERTERQRQNIADLEGFRTEAARLVGLSAGLQDRIDALQAERPKIIERYTTHVRESAPLPVGCIIDPVRLQHINAAIGAANAARQSGAAVPTHSGAGE